MADPIRNQIIDAIIAIIPNMTIANGYSQDFGDVNDWDPASRVYPTTFIDSTNEVSLLDEDNVVDRYTVNATINIKNQLETAADINKAAQQCVLDFGKMFKDNLSTLKAVGLITWDYVDSDIPYTLIKARPSEIIHNWEITYRRQKSSPYLS